jgi:glucose/arabinose dehydrogenase
VFAPLLAGLLLAAACNGDNKDDPPAATPSTAAEGTTTSTTEAPPEPMLGTIELATTEVVELDEPIALAARSSSRDLYIAERGGTVRIVKVTPPTSGTGPPRYQLQTTPLLDLTDEVLAGGERGLLGIAFSSDGRKLYVDYTAEPDGRTMVVEYSLGDRATVDLDSRRELLEVEQPFANHNGGNLVTGPDGYLYVGLGDGGDAGDPDGRAQDTSELLGSILRIDPEGAAKDGDPPYGIPAGNPFAGSAGAAPEIWLYGARNPWRFSFDSTTGDLWIGDVGQGSWEEIDWLPSAGGFDAGRGANLGWDRMEGSHRFEGENPEGAVLPIFEYSHDEGCSITGGYVYRGEAIEALRGVYLFADYCGTGIRGLQLDGATIVDERTWDLPLAPVISFGEDNDGELYVLLQSGPVLKVTTPRAVAEEAEDASSGSRSTSTSTTTSTSTSTDGN